MLLLVFAMPNNVIILSALRQPGTSGWNGAFVAVRDENGDITMAVFENGKDFIANQVSMEELNESVETLTNRGWVTMTRDDVKKTAGV